MLAGIQWVIQNQATDNIRVLNLSLGHPVCDTYTNDPLCQAVEAAWQAGIVVVCAAGNEGRLNTANTVGTDNEGWGTSYGSVQSPANDPYVITVGAMKQADSKRADDKVATYSSRGPTLGDATLKPDLVAPGNKVISLDVKGSTLDTAFNGSNRIPLSAYVKQGQGASAGPDVGRLLPVVRHLDGLPRGGRGGGAAVAAEPVAVAGHDQGPSDGLGG